MKISYVEAFDNKSHAYAALGFFDAQFPGHENRLVEGNNQVQLRWIEGGSKGTEIIGDPDDKEVFIVLSIAP